MSLKSKTLSSQTMMMILKMIANFINKNIKKAINNGVEMMIMTKTKKMRRRKLQAQVQINNLNNKI